MLKNQICITNSKILYEILNEIKEELNFELIFKKEFSKEKQSHSDNSNFKNIIFLVTSNLILKKKSQIDCNRILSLENFPIKIWKLIEIINIFFLKINFKLQSNIFIKNYELNLNSRSIYKNKKFLKLTEKEVLVILFLFGAKNPTNVSELKRKVWKQKSILETHTVETHIYRLRRKFSKVFNDNSFILSKKMGYSI